MLHAAYRPLAEAGLRYVATHQSPDVTAARISRGECFVAADGGRLVGTITLIPPGRGRACAYYERPDVAYFQQFGVHPDYQGRGIGRKLRVAVEDRARELGAAVIALDTAESARELIAMYERHGYTFVSHVDWRPHVNYRSVILARRLR